MMATTIISSIRVKPFLFFNIFFITVSFNLTCLLILLYN
jgi:hypothetical protein